MPFNHASIAAFISRGQVWLNPPDMKARVRLLSGMRAFALFLLLITVLPASAVPGDGVQKAFTGVTIDSYGPMPPFGSGVVMVLRIAHVTTATGEKRDFYFIHAGDDQFLSNRGAHPYPAPGSRCEGSTATRHVSGDPSGLLSGDGGPADPVGDVIEEIRC